MIENTVLIDTETDIRFGLLDSPPWKGGNPKKPIHGVYRRGLDGSLGYFGNRDRLKVWPNPQNKSRYIVLNGNQRVDVIWEHELTWRLANHFNLDEDFQPSEIARLKADPDNTEIIKQFKQEIYDWQIPCQIITHLREGKKFTLHDAMTFVAVWDRNHAQYDEAILASQFREARDEMLKGLSEQNKVRREKLLEKMIRPERVFNTLPLAESKESSQDNSGMAPTGNVAPPPSAEFTPTEDEPWGPPPTQENENSNISTNNKTQPPSPYLDGVRASARVPTELIPLVLSLTPDGYKKITNEIIRSKSHLFREQKLAAALENLYNLLSNPDDAEDSIVCELALLLINTRIEISKASKV